jgi:hypothetical protein
MPRLPADGPELSGTIHGAIKHYFLRRKKQSLHVKIRRREHPSKQMVLGDNEAFIPIGHVELRRGDKHRQGGKAYTHAQATIRHGRTNAVYCTPPGEPVG